jgi:hypothetical protein
MVYPRWTLGACAVLVLCAGSVNQADQPQLTPKPGVLVLRGGRVLRGEIIRIGDRYVVTLGGKDELGVPADSVELQCDTLENVYQQRRDALPLRRSAADHLALADWCLRYELMAPAAEQLMAAQQLEPDSPAGAAFERRLRLAAQRSSPTAPQAAASQPLVSQTDLDQFIRGMPAGTVEQFTNIVQPLLINRCGASGCHGPNCDSSFRLAYPNWSRILPRRFTQRNLYAAMQHVDMNKPEDSPLLVKATSAHGTRERPTLGNRDTAQIDQLVDWVHRCTSSPTPPANLSSPDSVLLQPEVQQRAPASGGPAPGAEPARPAAASTGGPPADTSGGATTTAAVTSRAAPPAPADRAGVQDPFDPEIFNRRYLRRPQ